MAGKRHEAEEIAEPAPQTDVFAHPPDTQKPPRVAVLGRRWRLLREFALSVELWGFLVAGASFHLYLRSKQVKMVAGLNRAISDYLTMASRDIVIPQDELFATWA